ncbi:histidine kinase dimerization/phospho-acceptor domain-containing protein [Sulfitobacter brevis]|uniref:histidine kinase dimerization/phospho-acceptor domain-containing protein n=1 Tax=Sulfitobacter brevis TaxID=74348 RepID=UPI0015A6A5D1|nr:histidine kinase dimerization/phospho-acceptor domain-containing protein [Sulfitobacter brevis]
MVDYDIDLSVFDNLMSALVANDSRVAALDTGPEDDAVALELAELLQKFDGDLRTSSLDVLQASLVQASDVRTGVLRIAKTVLYMSLTILVAAMLLFIAFALDSVLTRRALTEKEALLQEAYAADIAKSQFISVMNHELRTPLTSISASLALLKSGVLPHMPAKASRLR